MLAVAIAIFTLVATLEAQAHGLGMSQLQLHVAGPRIEGEWDLHLRDARLAAGLDPALGGEAGFRDLQAHEPALRAALARALVLSAHGQTCPIEITPAPLEWHADQTYVRLRLHSQCAQEPTRLGIRCELLFDIDPMHRAYFSVEDARVISVGVFRTNLRAVTIDVRQFHLLPAVAEFIGEGVRHIWSGLDHCLFLLALLLPAPLVRSGREWSPRVGLWATTRETLKVVTAFTLAHSVTLCLSFFGIVTPPAQWVEVSIALSVFAAAWNNLRPFLPGRAWLIALTFGLVHGLGFAGALRNLSLPRHARGVALGAFNVGVEIGQVAIVIVALPLLYTASRQRQYPRFVMGLGSLVIAWLAVLWVLERGFGITLFAH